MSAKAELTKEQASTDLSGGRDIAFWRSYVAGRPSPSEGFFELINDYHTGEHAVAHDIGTGPGNIASRLTRYFNHVVGSDMSDQVIAAAYALNQADVLKRMTFVHSPAEDIASGVVPKHIGNGKTDLVVVSECIPLLDPVKSLKAFHTLLRPGGTLAIYFYGRPLFVDGDTERCNQVYDRLATRAISFLGTLFEGSPEFPGRKHAAETIVNWLDNIALPSEQWQRVERYRWNNDAPLLFSSVSGYNFTVDRLDHRGKDDVTKEIIDRTYWQDEWDVDRVADFLAVVFPAYRERAGEEGCAEIDNLIEELKVAMNGTRKVCFTVSLVLATKN